MGIQCQILSVKFKFYYICTLKTYDTRRKILLIQNFKECSWVTKRAINYFLSILLSIERSPSLRIKWRQMYGRKYFTLSSTATYRVKFDD